jgi:hypothetical protein
MNKLFFAAAIGAAIVSSQAAAQAAPPPQGGGMQQDFTRQEAQQSADSMFQRLDANHDGTLTRDEAEQARAQMGGRGGHMIERAFATASSLTLAQFEAAALARFDAMDTNHDGIVTAAERDQARAQRAAAGGGHHGERG